MRAFWLSLLVLTSASCSTPSDKAVQSKSKIEVTYRLSIWTVDQLKRPIGTQRNRDAKFDQLPSDREQARLLQVAKSPELQIVSRCYVEGVKLNCHDLGTWPESAELADQARAFLRQFRISADSVSQTSPPANFGHVEVRIAFSGTRLAASGNCILSSQCGVPTPAAPPPPNTVNDH